MLSSQLIFLFEDVVFKHNKLSPASQIENVASELMDLDPTSCIKIMNMFEDKASERYYSVMFYKMLILLIPDRLKNHF